MFHQSKSRHTEKNVFGKSLSHTYIPFDTGYLRTTRTSTCVCVFLPGQGQIPATPLRWQINSIKILFQTNRFITILKKTFSDKGKGKEIFTALCCFHWSHITVERHYQFVCQSVNDIDKKRVMCGFLLATTWTYSISFKVLSNNKASSNCLSRNASVRRTEPPSHDSKRLVFVKRTKTDISGIIPFCRHIEFIKL